MPPLWIAVEEGIGDSAKVWRFAQLLMIAEPPPTTPRSPTRAEVAAAIGFLVQLWLKVADKRETGFIEDLPDGLLASWAGWDGDVERFARTFRGIFQVDGAIHDWEKHQGKLIAYRAKERARWQARKAAATAGDALGVSTGDTTEPPPPDSQSDSESTVSPSVGPIRSEADLHAALAPQDRESIEHFLTRASAGDSNARFGWVMRLGSYLQGLDFPPGPAPTSSDLGTACRDYTGNFAPIHFRGFVLRVMRARMNPRPPSIATGTRTARVTRATVDQYRKEGPPRG